MVCIYCGEKTKVTNSRPQKRSNSTWRRRECINCSSVTTSIEKIDLGTSIAINDGAGLQPFSRDKLLISVYESLKHRKTALRDASELTNTIISQVTNSTNNPSISKEDLTSTVITALKRFDKVAAVHYKAYYATSSLA